MPKHAASPESLPGKEVSGQVLSFETRPGSSAKPRAILPGVPCIPCIDQHDAELHMSAPESHPGHPIHSLPVGGYLGGQPNRNSNSTPGTDRDIFGMQPSGPALAELRITKDPTSGSKANSGACRCPATGQVAPCRTLPVRRDSSRYLRRKLVS